MGAHAACAWDRSNGASCNVWLAFFQVLDDFVQAQGNSWMQATTDNKDSVPFLDEALAKYQVTLNVNTSSVGCISGFCPIRCSVLGVYVGAPRGCRFVYCPGTGSISSLDKGLSVCVCVFDR